MGCVCGKGFDLGNLTEDNKNSSNQANKSDDNDKKTDDKNGKDDSDDSGKKTNPFETPTPRKSASSGDVPPEAETTSMVKETLSDFADAVESENFESFHSKTSPEFQKQYSADRLKSKFFEFILDKDKTVPIINSAIEGEPTYTIDPYIKTQSGRKILVVNGRYPSKVPVRFENQYLLSGNQWKIISVGVYINQ